MYWIAFLLKTVLFFTAFFMIILVLIQRGKGGGLSGAFGGMGGQSAFGTKAGDLFTKITIGVATFWILMCVLTAGLLGSKGTGTEEGGGVWGDETTTASQPLETPATGEGAPAVPQTTPPTAPTDAPAPSAPTSTTPPSAPPATPAGSDS